MSVDRAVSSEEDARVRSRISAFLALLTASITLVMTLLALANGDPIQALVEGLSTLVALGAFVACYRGRWLTASALVVILTIGANVVFSSFHLATPESVTSAWTAILALAAYSLAGRTAGIVVAGLGLVFVWTSFLLETSSFASGTRATENAIELSFMIVVCLGIIWLFEKKNHLELSQARERTGQLRAANRELEAALLAVNELQAQLVEAERHGSLQRLAGHFAHDFNNLLTGIMAEVDLANHSTDDPEIEAGLENALASARKAADLTRSMLTYSGKRTTRNETVEVDDIFSDVTMLADGATRHGVDLMVERSDPSVRFEGDGSQIVQALLNLVLNGVQASDEERPRIVLSAANEDLEQAVQGAGGTRCEEGRAVRLTVRDYGRGIPERIVDQIFEPYFTTRESGQGLGLSSVIGILRGHRGALVVRPAAPGTEMDLYLRASGAED